MPAKAEAFFLKTLNIGDKSPSASKKLFHESRIFAAKFRTNTLAIMRNLKICALLLSATILLASCGMNNTAKGALIGAGSGTALGALIGKWSGNTALGAGIGAVAGTAAGVIIGKKMDKAKEQAAQIEGATVEAETDSEGNTVAVKVTLAGDVTFATNEATLNATSKSSLASFAQQLASDVDLAVIGHTDNTGTDAINNPLSENRALAVKNYLVEQGIASSRFQSVTGKGSTEPVATNSTAEGRAQNRRAEIYLLPSQTMIDNANNGVE